MPDLDVDLAKLLRIAELLDEGLVLAVGVLTMREETVLVMVRDERREYAKRRDRRNHPPPPIG